MKFFRKAFVIVGFSSVLLCTNAFADEITYNGENAEDISLEEQSSEMGIVTVDVLNVRSGPSTETEIVGKLSLGTSIEILSESENWYKISFNSKTAYICGEYIKIVNSALIEKQNLNGIGVVEYAKKFIGTPYAYGGNTPKGFDCSGFVQYVMSNFEVKMPRSSTEQYSVGERVNKSQLIPGDLVYFKYSSNSNNLNHVGIYVGEGNFIHSTAPGQAVRIDTLASGYFSNYYYGATRIIR
jgi:uncharacterized protein YgiM (DUF1202 family)